MDIIYVDMDNVLVDFPWGIDQLSDDTRREYQGKFDEIPNFFRDLPPVDGAIDGFHRLSGRYDTYILSTSPWNNPSAWTDKLLWVKDHLPEVGHKRLILSHHKNLNQGDYLIDDRKANGAGQFPGKHLQFGSAEFPDWEAILRYLL
ncbi:5' nucleotidase, NT5C type [Fodinibius sediminis]|uniref:5' nucleotidase, deoxy (Pyrimidine), type C protein (NT5C) n=1 Tax=Fodinibius sediminis TaxID=1214077 RepID=A0A521BYM6_9BACT|nr:hypothetical protein [Fodinibius sediminis]SMO51600.1 5' nucleotidase, deoxy (Pyrimidine), type C protein (NT5C) [Fodinibius sediminis]